MDNDHFSFECILFDITVGWKSLIALGFVLLAVAAIVYANHAH